MQIESYLCLIRKSITEVKWTNEKDFDQEYKKILRAVLEGQIKSL